MSDELGKRMDVRRVEHEGGSHIEPPLVEDWDDLTALEWKAGVVHADTGLDITVKPGGLIVNGCPQEDFFSITIRSMSASAFTYEQASIYMNGISTGHRATLAKQVRDGGESHG